MGLSPSQSQSQQMYHSYYHHHQLDPDRIVGLKKVWKDSFWGCLDFSIRTLGAQPGLEISALVQLLLLRNVEKSLFTKFAESHLTQIFELVWCILEESS